MIFFFPFFPWNSQSHARRLKNLNFIFSLAQNDNTTQITEFDDQKHVTTTRQRWARDKAPAWHRHPFRVFTGLNLDPAYYNGRPRDELFKSVVPLHHVIYSSMCLSSGL